MASAGLAMAELEIGLEPRGAVAAVETVRDGAVALAVLRHIGVEKKQPRVADARQPHLHRELAAGEGELDREVAAVLLHRLDRQIGELRVAGVGALASLRI